MKLRFGALTAALLACGGAPARTDARPADSASPPAADCAVDAGPPPVHACDCTAETRSAVDDAVATANEAAAKSRKHQEPALDLQRAMLPSGLVERTWRLTREPKILFGLARESDALPATKAPANLVGSGRTADKLVVVAARTGRIETVFELRAGIAPMAPVSDRGPLGNHLVALDAQPTDDGELVVSAVRGCDGTVGRGGLEPYATWDAEAAKSICAGVGRYRWNGRTFAKQR